MKDIKGNFFQLLLDRDHLINLVDVYHGMSLKNEEDISKLTLELDFPHDSLKGTQSSIQ